MIGVFYVYDFKVQRRNRKLVLDAAKSNTIVTNMFPGTLREKMIEQGGTAYRRSTATEMKELLKNGVLPDTNLGDTPPLAELYPDCSVLLADIVGFTAWSSVREPANVFRLLETVYR